MSTKTQKFLNIITIIGHIAITVYTMKCSHVQLEKIGLAVYHFAIICVCAHHLGKYIYDDSCDMTTFEFLIALLIIPPGVISIIILFST